LLAYVDLQNLNQKASHVRERYELAFCDIDGFDIVSDPSQLPEDFGIYQYLSWASHGYSDPTSWAKSHLTCGERKITAKRIIENWELTNTFVAILSACETGIDKSVREATDEYFGLDMALHVAGAPTVISTMWPVEETLAGLMDMALMEGVIKHQESASEYLRRLRLDLVSGQWKENIRRNYEAIRKNRAIDDSVRTRHLKLLAPLMHTNHKAFEKITSWGAYRCFGNW
jgi:CHAT domain-containing protein